jgi:hypothetical protein
MEQATKNTPPQIQHTHQDPSSEQTPDYALPQPADQNDTDTSTDEELRGIEQFAHVITVKTKQQEANNQFVKTWIREKYPFPIYRCHTATDITITGGEEQDDEIIDSPDIIWHTTPIDTTQMEPGNNKMNTESIEDCQRPLHSVNNGIHEDIQPHSRTI